MQYFTPELFVRLQDLKDRAAAQEWDRAAERYVSALKQISPQFPAALQKLAGPYLLHDAEILCISHSRKNLAITLQPEQEDGHLLVLSYTLVEDPQLDSSAFPEPYQTEYVAWLYDELGLMEPMARRPAWGKGTTGRQERQVPVYCHDILLSNGCELLLRFRQFKVTRRQRLIPAPRPVEGERTGKLSESA